MFRGFRKFIILPFIHTRPLNNPLVSNKAKKPIKSSLSQPPKKGYYTSIAYNSTMAANPLDKVRAVDISPDGTYKYILIKLTHTPKGGQEDSRIVVRGYTDMAFHGDIYEAAEGEFEKLGLAHECIGGGRIKHTAAAKTLEVYGYSQGYGRADHSITVAKLKEKYPDYTITFTNEGY